MDLSFFGASYRHFLTRNGFEVEGMNLHRFRHAYASMLLDGTYAPCAINCGSWTPRFLTMWNFSFLTAEKPYSFIQLERENNPVFGNTSQHFLLQTRTAAKVGKTVESLAAQWLQGSQSGISQHYRCHLK